VNLTPCDRLHIDEPLDQAQRNEVEARLREIEATGIGERRGEGYGQLRFNATLLTSPLRDWAAAGQPAQGASGQQMSDTSVPAPLTAADNDEAYAYAQRLELVAWREALQRVVLGIADNEQRRQEILHIRLVRQRNRPPQSQPPLSQLGGLRTVLQDLHSAADRPRVLQWLEHLKNTPNRSDKWPEGALSALTNLLQDETAIWKALVPEWQTPPVLTAPRDPAATGGRVGELQTRFWAEAVRALVDACLRAHKRDTESSTPAQETTHGT
jgi:CRISPR-associated protein Csx10